MTVNLANTADGGTNAATVTPGNSGGTSGPAYDTVVSNTGSTGVLSYDKTHVLGGHPLAVKAATGGTSTQVYLSWGASLTATGITQVWFREYLYFTGNPASNVRVFNTLTTGSAQCGGINVTTTGVLSCVIASGAAATSTVTAIPLNSWFRIEGFLIGDPSVGQVQVKLFTTADASIPAETKTTTAAQNTTGAVGFCRFGVATSLANIGPFWVASPGVSDTGLLGPEAPVSGVPQACPGPAWLANFKPFSPRPRLVQELLAGPSAQNLAITLAGSVTAAGALARQADQSFAGTTAAAGSITQQAGQSLAGSTASAGTMSRRPTKGLAGSAVTAGALTRQAGESLAGSAGTAGTLARQAGKSLPGAVTTAGSTGRQPAKGLAGSASTSGSAGRAAAKTLAGTGTASGRMARQASCAYPAAATSTGALSRQAARALAAAAVTAGALARTVQQAYAGTATTAAALARQPARTFTATAVTTGALTAGKVILITLAGVASTAGSLIRGVGKALRSAAASAGAILFPPPPPSIHPAGVTIAPAGNNAATATISLVITGTAAVAPAGGATATVAIAGAPAIPVTITIAPAGNLAATATAAAPGQRPQTWQPAPPLAFPAEMAPARPPGAGPGLPLLLHP